MWIVLKDAQTAAQRIGCLVLSPKMKESAASRKSSNADVAASCLSSSHPPVPVPSSIGNIGKEAKDSTLRPDTVLFQRSTDEQKVTCQIGAKNPTGRLHIPNLIRQDRTSLAEVLFQAQTPFDTLDETLHNLNNYLIEDNLQGNTYSIF